MLLYVFMTATAHGVIGTVIAAKIGNPALAAPIALVSHFAADLFPHWDTGTHWREKNKTRFFLESLSDAVLSFVLSYVLIVLFFPTLNIPYAFFIIIISQLPDWIMSPYLFFKIRAQPFVWMYQFQRKLNARLDKPWGIINQIAVLVLIVILAKIF